MSKMIELFNAEPATYSETLWGGVSSWLEYLLARLPAGHAIKEDEKEAFEMGWTPMNREKNQSMLLPVYKDGKHKRTISITVYRMESGRYEITAYLG